MLRLVRASYPPQLRTFNLMEWDQYFIPSHRVAEKVAKMSSFVFVCIWMYRTAKDSPSMNNDYLPHWSFQTPIIFPFFVLFPIAQCKRTDEDPVTSSDGALLKVPRSFFLPNRGWRLSCFLGCSILILIIIRDKNQGPNKAGRVRPTDGLGLRRHPSLHICGGQKWHPLPLEFRSVPSTPVHLWGKIRVLEPAQHVSKLVWAGTMPRIFPQQNHHLCKQYVPWN